MSDATSPFTLAEIEAAAQPVRFGLLGLSSLGWFRARPAGTRLGVQRGTVRAQADALVDLGLAEKRDLTDLPSPTFEWRITVRGAQLHARLAELISEATELPPPPEDPPLMALVALGSGVSDADLPTTLEELARRAKPVFGYWLQEPV